MRAWTDSPRIDRPAPGFYRVRLVKGGPLVPARIFESDHTDPDTGEAGERPRHLVAEVAGQPADLDQVWIGARPIEEKEYRYMMAMMGWAEQHAPDHPAANPRQAVDLDAMPPAW